MGVGPLPADQPWPETVTAAFNEFVAHHTTLTELQLRFLQTLRTFLLQNRRATRSELLEAPFTQLHPHGVRGVFAGADLQAVIKLAETLVA